MTSTTKATEAAVASPPHSERLTLSQIVRLLLEESPDQAPYVRLSRNAKGGTDIDVSVPVSSSSGAATIAEAGAIAEQEYDRLASKYPPPGNGASSDRSSVSLSRNAKGETQIEVTAHTDGAESEGQARIMYDRLRSTYPLSSGLVGAAPEPSKVA